MRVAAWLIIGALLGAGFSRFAHTFRWGAKMILGYGLMAAAILYLPMAILGEGSAAQTVVQPVGIVLYWTTAFLGIRGSSWWLVAGWVTRPLWNVALHHLWPGIGLVPTWYTITCAGFDLMVAATIVVYEGLAPAVAQS
jgi:hypothetical protein